MAYIFKPRFPKLHIVTVDGKPKGKPVIVEHVAARSPRKGQRIKVVKREPGRDAYRRRHAAVTTGVG